MTHLTITELWIIRWSMAGAAFLLTYLLICGFDKICEIVKQKRSHTTDSCAAVSPAQTGMSRNAG